jgi:hypothetical protein
MPDSPALQPVQFPHTSHLRDIGDEMVGVLLFLVRARVSGDGKGGRIGKGVMCRPEEFGLTEDVTETMYIWL